MARLESPRVLRIAVIHRNRITTERLIRPGTPVFVGTDLDNQLIVPENAITGERFLLFEPDEGRVRLHFTRAFGKGSKLALDGRSTALEALRGAEEGLLLDPGHRGKLVLDDVVLLFQFVMPPPTPPLIVLPPMDFRPRLLDADDPLFLGSLATWSVLALILSVWVWNSEAPAYNVDAFVERLATLERPSYETAPVMEPEPVAEVEVAVAAVERLHPVAHARPPDRPSHAVEPRGIDRAREEVLNNSPLLARLIGTSGDSAIVVENAWQQDGVGSNIDALLAQHPSGVAIDGDEGLRVGCVGCEDGPMGIGDMVALDDGGSSVRDGMGGGPEVRVVVESPPGTVSEEIADVAKVKRFIDRKRGRIKYCYDQVLKENAKVQGRVELSWEVLGGQVLDVAVVSDTARNAELRSCLVEQIQGWSFPKEIDGEISWPFVFRSK